MGEFIAGLGGASPTARAQHSYPDNPRAAALALFARNFATGPKIDTAVGLSTQIPWNFIDSEPTFVFGVAAGGVTVTIPGDVTGSFANGDIVELFPTVPVAGPGVVRLIASNPAFAAGVTTFDISAPVDGSTTVGAIRNGTSNSVDVPITPRTTGVVRIQGIVLIGNTTGAPIDVTVNVQVNGTNLPVPTQAAAAVLDATTGIETLPFLAETLLPVGVTSLIQISVDADGATLIAEDSSVEIQEVSFATG